MAYRGSDSDTDSDEITMGGYTDLPPEERPGYKPKYSQPIHPTFTARPQWGADAPAGRSGVRVAAPGQLQTSGAGRGEINFSQANIRYTAKPVVNKKPEPKPQAVMPVPPPQFPGYGQQPPPPPPPGAFPGSPPPPGMFPNAPPPPPGAFPGAPPPPPGVVPYDDLPPPPGQSKIPAGARFKEIVPPGLKPASPPKGGLRPHGASFSGGSRPNLRAPSPNGLGGRMNRLSVSGDRPDVSFVQGGRPPASPMLEAYQGTWQEMPPMPSPLMMGRRYDDDDIDDLEPLDKRDSRSHKKGSKRAPSPKKKVKKAVTLFNEQAEDEARAIAGELSSSKPDMQVLIDILPALSHDEMMELRTEYKRVCKIQGRGINIAKHIKMKLSGNFCKICYVTALGRWESEGYWANYWYQSNSAKRELLIESLMGRTDAEIRNIKDTFKDKRYNDDLVRCMEKELKADKFRTAVLLALDEKRQDENDEWPIEYRNRDVDTLYKTLHGKGGETAILEIVLNRSDNHLRDVLRTYERKYGKNFAKECLKKSHNLVGEVVAHVLNGIINKPARDALLLHHALEDLAPNDSPRGSRSDIDPRSSKTDVKESKKKDRYELLISRLVRMHWDRMHFMRVKLDYKERYGHYLEEDIEDYIRGEDFREFCLVLCESTK